MREAPQPFTVMKPIPIGTSQVQSATRTNCSNCGNKVHKDTPGRNARCVFAQEDFDALIRYRFFFHHHIHGTIIKNRRRNGLVLL